MQNLFRLDNAVKHYEWGSREWIPALCGLPSPASEPWAELWMGAHPASPSLAETPAGPTPLDAYIARNPEAAVGARTAGAFGGLPFLFKLLAADKPLSIQAHPSLDQAREGWARENAARIPLDAPNRNYKDANHKPEILCALSPFRAMCGFRERAEIRRLLDALDLNRFAAARRALEGDDEGTSLRSFQENLFALSEEARRDLGRAVADRAASLGRGAGRDGQVWELVREFAAAYPADPAIVSPLYLNVLDLEPGEAIYLPAGILHAYVRGFGVELMANSDNVLRGGLTSKHVDLDELNRTLRFAPFKPDILAPADEDAGLKRYRTPCAEFSLARATAAGGSVLVPEGEPHIVVVTGGAATLRDDRGQLPLAAGQSAFITASARASRLEGDFTAFIASVGWPTGNVAR